LFKDPLFNSSFQADPAGRFITVAQLNVVKVPDQGRDACRGRIVAALAAA
jgi:hypothetical protein